MKRTGYFCCVLVLALAGEAQESFAATPGETLVALDDLSWVQATRKLVPSAIVSALAIDERGRLCVGTLDGLYRFDGSAFEKVPNVGGLPELLLPLSDGSLLVGDATGLAPGAPVRDGLELVKNDRPTLATVKDGLRERLTLPTGTVVWGAAQSDDGRVYLGTSRGLRVLTKAGVAPVAQALPLEDLPIRAIHAEKNVGIWVGTDEGLALLSSSHLNRRVGLIPGPVRAFAAGRKGELWVAAADGLFLRPSIDATVAPAPIVSIAGGFHAITVDTSNRVWLAARQGVFVLENGLLRGVGKDQGVPDTGIFALLADERGGIWLGTRSTGLIGLQRPWVRTVAEGALVRAVARGPNGQTFVSTPSGLARVEGSQLQQQDAWLARWSQPNVMSALDDGTLFVASDAGVVLWKEGKGSLVPLGPTKHVVALAAVGTARAFELWVGFNDGGLAHAKLSPAVSGVITELFAPPPGGCDGEIRRILPAATGGVHLAMDRGLTTFTHDAPARCLKLDLPARSDAVLTSVLRDERGTLWIGSRAGLFMVANDRFHRLTERDGLPCDEINDVLTDHSGNLWAACVGGVARLPLDSLYGAALRGEQVQGIVFKRRDGMLSEESVFRSSPALSIDDAGHLWVATLLGLAVIRDLKAGLPQPPQAHIQSLRLGGRVQGDAAFTALSTTLEAEVQTPVLDVPERLMLRHRLIGRDQVVSRPRPDLTHATIRYDGLSPGRYTLQIEASTGFGAWSPPVSRSFEIKAPWHKTLWFYILIACAGLGAGFGIHRLRLRSARARFSLINSDRARIARELHDSVAQGLTSLSFFFDAMEQRFSETVPTLAPLVSGGRQVIAAMRDSVRDAVWDLRRDDLETISLKSGLQKVVLAATRQGVAPTVELLVEQDEVLPALALHELLAIAAEAITNSLRHARATRVLVWARREDGTLVLSIEDNGVGMPPPSSTLGDVGSGHFGILGMRERARRIGALFALTSRINGGTLIEVRLPPNRSS